jgi:hypothetical protein
VFRRAIIVVLFFAAFALLAFGYDLPNDGQPSRSIAMHVAAK